MIYEAFGLLVTYIGTISSCSLASPSTWYMSYLITIFFSSQHLDMLSEKENDTEFSTARDARQKAAKWNSTYH